MKPSYSIQQAARAMRMSVKDVRAAIKRGEIVTRKEGRRVVIDWHHIDAFFRRRLATAMDRIERSMRSAMASTDRVLAQAREDRCARCSVGFRHELFHVTVHGPSGAWALCTACARVWLRDLGIAHKRAGDLLEDWWRE